MEKPGKLKELPENRVLKLSEIIDTTKINYAESYSTSSRLEGLQTWISEQVDLFNNSGKK